MNRELRNIARRVRRRTTRQYGVWQPICHIAAPLVTAELVAAGIPATTVRGAYVPAWVDDFDKETLVEHYWTETDTGYIIDITLDQLGWGRDRPEVRVRRGRSGGCGTYMTQEQLFDMMAVSSSI
jgi:hypothetical protein